MVAAGLEECSSRAFCRNIKRDFVAVVIICRIFNPLEQRASDPVAARTRNNDQGCDSCQGSCNIAPHRTARFPVLENAELMALRVPYHAKIVECGKRFPFVLRPECIGRPRICNDFDRFAQADFPSNCPAAAISVSTSSAQPSVAA